MNIVSDDITRNRIESSCWESESSRSHKRIRFISRDGIQIRKLYEYSDPEDFYYDNSEDFDGYDDAETYYDDAWREVE